MWIERELAGELRRLARAFPVLVLVGPRQVGKTALLGRVFADYRYVSLDDPSLAAMAETRPRDFLAAFPPPLLIDEVQYAPTLFRHLKAALGPRPARGRFVLTGSQNFTLMRGVSESLAGRSAVIPFLGLSASEWGAARGLPRRRDPIEFLWRGGFPALWADPKAGPDRDRWYQGYVSTYLERDVRNLLVVGSLRDFERFLRACAGRTAQMLNMSDIARDVGVSPPTVRQWLSVLQASNQVLLLEPYHRSLGKRLAKSPKLYFTDTGLAAYLMGYPSAAALWAGPHAGALWENHVVAQWLRWRDWRVPSASLWYWRDQPGNEVDLLVEQGGRLTAIECRRTEHPDIRDGRGIAHLRRFYGPEAVTNAFLACTTDRPYELAPGLTAVPGWTVWELPA